VDFRKRFLADRDFKITSFDPNDTAGWTEPDALAKAEENTRELAKLQDKLYAQRSHACLTVLQGLDASGKDGTIKHVMSGVNPQGCSVTSFKQPTPKELEHDFLWRVHQAAPGRGYIGIFNRSHYEDVLVVRVHNLVPEEVCSKRYRQIRDFERMLYLNSTVITKFFLHISKDEQEKRFIARLTDPHKNWKFSVSDAQESKFFDDYQKAYDDAIRETTRKYGPWYVIPANHKWFRNLAVSQIIVDTLEDLHLQYPPPLSNSAVKNAIKSL
jgi:PPK2 family polyphosphate:nucleotide phosphotransferase